MIVEAMKGVKLTSTCLHVEFEKVAKAHAIFQVKNRLSGKHLGHLR